MPELVPTLGILAVVLLAFFGMARGWRARQRRQASFLSPHPVPGDVGGVLLQQNLMYVATTLAAQPLERVVVAGLGIRGRATVTVAESGVVLALAGQEEYFLPAAALIGAGAGTFVVDRAVERDGLAVISWRLGGGSPTTPGTEPPVGVPVDTYLRTPDEESRRALVSAVQLLVERADSGAAAFGENRAQPGKGNP